MTINPNGGIWNLSNSIITSNVVDGTIMTINEPTREGYIFLGWTLTGTGSSITNTTFIMGKSNTTLVANWLAPIYEFSYTGNIQTFNVPHNGWYQVELWGAQGGSNVGYEGTVAGNVGGLGGYTKGKIYLLENEILNIVIGGAGSYATSINNASTKGYNGGGMAGYEINCSTCMKGAGGGGGATDIRYNETSLNDRIMVASGGGGAANWFSPKAGGAGGNLIGNNGEYYSAGSSSYTNAGGGGQIAGGNAGSGSASGTAGIFGVGGDSYATHGSGGGGGYYGGVGGAVNSNVVGSGGGGSSFISGYSGVNAITTSSSLTPTNNTIHYSGKYFINGTMTAGVNEGNGKAKITYLSDTKPNRVNNKLNNVRYIKDCMNGSNANDSNHWVELQSIKDGQNLAKGLVGKLYNSSNQLITEFDQNHSYTYVTDGQISNITAAQGFGTGITYNGQQCFVIDLGQSYDLDEIAVWHYYQDGRTYYNNITYVSSDNTNWTEVIKTTEKETSNGKRVSAYGEDKVYNTYTVTNFVTNGNFENGSTGWTIPSGGSISSTNMHLGSNSYYYSGTGRWIFATQNINQLPVGHKIYYSLYYNITQYNSSETSLWYSSVNNGMGTDYFTISRNSSTSSWMKGSVVATVPSGSQATVVAVNAFHKPNTTNLVNSSYVDEVLLIDLTATFGSGNEPSKEWCDANLQYLDGSKTLYLDW